MQGVYRQHILALLLMAVLAIFMSYPVIFHMRDAVAGQGGDPWQTMWRFETKGHQISSQFWQDISGTGAPRLSNLSIWPWMPIHLAFGEPAGYNIIWIISIVLSGYAMAVFIKILTHQKSIFSSAPLLAGIAYMFLPYLSAQALGHFGAMQLQWIPFICAAALTYIRKPSAWKVILLGALFTVQSWTEHHYALWLSIFAVIAMVVYRKDLLRQLRGFRLKSGMTTNALIAIFFIIFGVIVPYIPTIKLALQSNTLELGTQQTSRFSADIFSFIVPSAQHPIWGSIFHTYFGQYFTGNAAESTQFLGLSVILAILFFHRHVPIKQKRLWVIAIVVFGLIGLGPVLHVFGKETRIALPYALLAHLPVFSAIRVVARAGVMVGFATVILFGWTIATNIHRTRTAVIVSIVLLLEFLVFPFPMQSAQLSPAYDAVTSSRGSRIIEIPAATNYTAASRSLYASALHNKHAIGNIALERGETSDTNEIAKTVPAIRQLLHLRTTELLEGRPEFFHQDLIETLPDAMEYLDAYTILVHTDSLSTLQNNALSNFLSRIPGLQKISYSDIDLYTLTQDKSLLESDGVLFIRGNGWENIGYDPKRNSTFGEISNSAYATIVNLNPYSLRIELQYKLAPKTQGELQTQKTLIVEPGERNIVFTHTGPGKSIIQNPSLIVSPFDPDHPSTNSEYESNPADL